MQLTVARRASAPISNAAFIFPIVIITRINWVANAHTPIIYNFTNTMQREEDTHNEQKVEKVEEGGKHEEGHKCCEEKPQKGQVVVEPMPQEEKVKL